MVLTLDTLVTEDLEKPKTMKNLDIRIILIIVKIIFFFMLFVINGTMVNAHMAAGVRDGMPVGPVLQKGS